MTVVLASHLPGTGRFRSSRHRVVGVPCTGPFDYSGGWRLFWQSDRCIVNVEHDMQCSDALIQELLDCPEPMCTFAYLLHHLPGGPHYAQRDGGPGYGEWITPGVGWCGFSGIGFCKVTPQARVGSLAASEWQTVDCAVFDATDGPWHVHWPEIAHHHK